MHSNYLIILTKSMKILYFDLQDRLQHQSSFVIKLHVRHGMAEGPSQHRHSGTQNDGGCISTNASTLQC